MFLFLTVHLFLKKLDEFLTLILYFRNVWAEKGNVGVGFLRETMLYLKCESFNSK